MAERADPLHELDRLGDLVVGGGGFGVVPERILRGPRTLLQRGRGVGELLRAFLGHKRHERMEQAQEHVERCDRGPYGGAA